MESKFENHVVRKLWKNLFELVFRNSFDVFVIKGFTVEEKFMILDK